jgi:hypothetical protein
MNRVVLHYEYFFFANCLDDRYERVGRRKEI